jgi:hypothetical protein
LALYKGSAKLEHGESSVRGVRCPPRPWREGTGISEKGVYVAFAHALIFLTKSEIRTVPVGAITELIRGDVFYWGQLMAAALLGSVPVAIIYSFFVDHYVAGLTAGSVKS